MDEGGIPGERLALALKNGRVPRKMQILRALSKYEIRRSGELGRWLEAIL